jgi:hypothetical protein
MAVSREYPASRNVCDNIRMTSSSSSAMRIDAFPFVLYVG